MFDSLGKALFGQTGQENLADTIKKADVVLRQVAEQADSDDQNPMQTLRTFQPRKAPTFNYQQAKKLYDGKRTALQASIKKAEQISQPLSEQTQQQKLYQQPGNPWQGVEGQMNSSFGYTPIQKTKSIKKQPKNSQFSGQSSFQISQNLVDQVARFSNIIGTLEAQQRLALKLLDSLLAKINQLMTTEAGNPQKIADALPMILERIQAVTSMMNQHDVKMTKVASHAISINKSPLATTPASESQIKKQIQIMQTQKNQ